MVSLKLEGKFFWGIVVGLIFLIGAGFVVGVWDSGKNMFHTSDDVKVTVDGVDYSLQEAVDLGLLEGSSPGECEVLRAYNPAEGDAYTGKEVVEVPSYCMSGRPCYIIVRLYASGAIGGLGGSEYYQVSNGYWMGNEVSNGRNGDAGSNRVASSPLYWVDVWDDWGGYENDADKWVYSDNVPQVSGEVVVCKY